VTTAARSDSHSQPAKDRGEANWRHIAGWAFQRARSGAVWAFAAIALAALFTGCWPLLALDLAPMGLQAVEAIGVTAGQSLSSRGGDTGTPEEDASKCEQLRTGMPYVTEVRKTADGGIELRQWGLGGNSGKPQWIIIYGRNASPEGWRHGPDLGELDFSPPLETAFAATEKARYLVFAPAQASDTRENEQLVSFISFFGPADGTFQWRGRTYNYAVAKALPCFSTTW
jgi:hypothetical protein